MTPFIQILHLNSDTMNPNTQTNIHLISECFIKPHTTPEQSTHPYYLTPWDLAMLSMNYIQKGLLYKKPPAALHGGDFIDPLLNKLKHSLSIALVHFYPLAGRLKTILYQDEGSSLIYVDCINTPGAKFIHAQLDMSISDLISPTDVPSIVESLFDHDRAVNHDGHSRPLLSVQITELLDGVFIGCSINHALVDGSSFWHFFNMWSEIFQTEEDPKITISRPPILQRWFPENQTPIIKLPFTNPDEFIKRYEAPQLTKRFFHFSTKSIAALKSKANTEYKTDKISSLQSLTALVWRAITRARGLSPETTTGCRLTINNRSRLNPPLPVNYFGNSFQNVRGVATAKELLENNLGWGAWKLHEAVKNHTDEKVRDHVKKWIESPYVYQFGELFDPLSVMVASSPRFDMYRNVFGMGKASSVRSGYAHKFDGRVTCYPGSEGGGSVDLEVSLHPQFMSVLEIDEEFMNAVTPNLFTSNQMYELC